MHAFTTDNDSVSPHKEVQGERGTRLHNPNPACAHLKTTLPVCHQENLPQQCVFNFPGDKKLTTVRGGSHLCRAGSKLSHLGGLGGVGGTISWPLPSNDHSLSGGDPHLPHITGFSAREALTSRGMHLAIAGGDMPPFCRVGVAPPHRGLTEGLWLPGPPLDHLVSQSCSYWETTSSAVECAPSSAPRMYFVNMRCLSLPWSISDNWQKHTLAVVCQYEMLVTPLVDFGRLAETYSCSCLGESLCCSDTYFSLKSTHSKSIQYNTSLLLSNCIGVLGEGSGTQDGYRMGHRTQRSSKMRHRAQQSSLGSPFWQRTFRHSPSLKIFTAKFW